MLIKGKNIKSQNLTKHGVENLVTMATTYTLNKKFQCQGDPGTPKKPGPDRAKGENNTRAS